MSNKGVLMHVDELSDLYLCDVLLDFIYPRVFFIRIYLIVSIFSTR